MLYNNMKKCLQTLTICFVGVMLLVLSFLAAFYSANAVDRYRENKRLAKLAALPKYDANDLFVWKMCQAFDLPENATTAQREAAAQAYAADLLGKPVSVVGKVADVEVNRFDGGTIIRLHNPVDTEVEKHETWVSIFAPPEADEFAKKLLKNDIIVVKGYFYEDICAIGVTGSVYFIDILPARIRYFVKK